MNADSIIQILISAAALGLLEPADAFLQTIHDKDVNEYNALVYSVYWLLTKAGQAASKTTTKLDDEGVQAAYSILQPSAAKNGITLPAITL